MAGAARLIHVHGLWLMPNIYAGRTAALASKPLVVSPRGMVSPQALRISKWRKRLFWKVLQRGAYDGAACWHATSSMEADEIRAFRIRSPIAVVPNGIDIPRDLFPKPYEKDKRVILYLGRLHRKKNLSVLLLSWAAVCSRHPEWHLEIRGPDEGGYSAELLALVSRHGVPRVQIGDALYGKKKWKALREAQVFVLPSLSENFGLTVAESLGVGTPVISTKGTPWQGLTEYRCGWWIDHGIQSLSESLEAAMRVSREELCEMGARGRNWIQRDFSWEKAAAQMISVYNWLTEGDKRPDCIDL